MIILGIVLLLVYYLLAHLQIFFIFGVILIIVGVVLMIAGRSGHMVGGRSHWY
jgi:hypothetical protein